VYCINLNFRKDRWKKFTSQAEVKQLQSIYSFERFDAVVGKNIDIENDARIGIRTRRNIIDGTRRDHEELDTPGGVGCYLSHATIWKNFLDREEEYAMVFEDDAILPISFVYRFQSALKDLPLLPKQPDIWYFSGPTRWYYESKGRPLPHTVPENHVGPWITPYCSVFTGYLLSKNGAKQLLEAAFPITMHVDLYSCLVGDLGKLNSVYHKRINITQDITVSTDIQNPGCKICDIPTKGLSTSTIVITLPVLLVGLSIFGVLFFIHELHKVK
jgi:GR25 family glycosyltransferase involved in LPS biosynthesis